MAKTLYEVKEGKLTLHLHEGQTRVWDSQARFIFMLAGTQGGKTSLGPWWLWKTIQELGSGDYLAVTSTYDLFKLKMLPELVKVYEGVLKAGRYWAGDKIIELFDPTGQIPHASRTQDPMWGRIILRSAVAEGGLESATAKAAWLDEAGQDQFGLSAWEAILRRLSLHQGRVLATTTLYNLGWIRQQVYKKWEKGDPEFDIIQFDSIQNPSFHRSEYERAQRDMPEWKFNMFYRGQFSIPPGQIYADFREGVHECDPFEIPHWWPVRVGIDFGAIHTALIWAAEDPETKVWYIYQESLDGGKTTEEHCTDALLAGQGHNVLGWFGGAPAETQQRMDWSNNGVLVQRPLVVDVESGIDRVIAMLRNRKLRVFNTCTKLLDEIARYSRKVTDTGDVLTEIRNKNDFHMCDALRYCCSAYELSIDWLEEAAPDNMYNVWSAGADWTPGPAVQYRGLTNADAINWDDVWS